MMIQEKPSVEPAERHVNLSLWLDCFRWISALLVVFTHANNRFLTKILSLPRAERGLAHYAFALLSGFGHQAVVVFFVLSGMLVGGGSLRFFVRTGTVGVRQYTLKRLTRLWIVLIPSFATSALFDRVGMSFFPAGDSTPYTLIPQHGIAIFVCNASFLQTAFCFPYGTNGALWSLFDEFWYYFAWLVVLVICARVGSFAGRALFFILPAGLLVALSMFQFVGPNIAAYSVIWLLGVLASARERPLLPLGMLPAAALVVAHLLLVRALVPTEWADETPGVWFVCDASLAFLFANLILSMKANSSSLVAPPGALIHKRLAGFAFSLYCTHPPLLNAYAAVMMASFGLGWHMVPSRMSQWAVVLGGIVTAVLFSYLFSLATEARTDQVRRSVDAWLGQILPSPPLWSVGAGNARRPTRN